MPEICRFYGIVIKMYFADHAPPHFHAEYAEFEARVAINNLAVLTGDLPPRAMALVAEWATLHQQELQVLWERASNLERSPRPWPQPYPRLWNRHYPQLEGRTADQHDAWVVAEWMRTADIDGRLAQAMSPELDSSERSAAEIEGWILGVGAQS